MPMLPSIVNQLMSMLRLAAANPNVLCLLGGIMREETEMEVPAGRPYLRSPRLVTVPPPTFSAKPSSLPREHRGGQVFGKVPQ